VTNIPILSENGNIKEFENSISERKKSIFPYIIRGLEGILKIYPDSNDPRISNQIFCFSVNRLNNKINSWGK